ncbi:MAG: right-handed parallel beta-helix repeat-containing protein [Clostridia bacterium]|nr:right-handed parallel beta-helix repeat-containing protein [Clostridia bacterium]
MKKVQHFIARLVCLVMFICMVIPSGVVLANDEYTIAFLGNTTLKNELVKPYPKQIQGYFEGRLETTVNVISANPIDFDSDDFMNDLVENVLPKNPDAVFLELDVSKHYAVTNEDLTARLESMVLAMLETEKVPAIYLIYFPEENMWDGRAPFQKVAERYELIVLDAFSHFKAQIESGKIVTREILTAGIIPGEEGHDRLSRFAINELKKINDLFKKPNFEAKQITSKRYTTVVQEVIEKEELKTDGTVLYVAPNGSDNAKGTLEAPLQSVEEARRRIRAVKQKEMENFRGATVYLRAGLYQFPDGLNFTEDDSGTNTAGVVYTAYEGEEVRFTNGSLIKPQDFKPVTDPKVLKRLHYKGVANILEYNLRDAGIEPGEFLIHPTSPKTDIVRTNCNTGSETRLALGNIFVVNGKDQQRAQYPNGGWDEVAAHQDGIEKHLAFSGSAPDRWNTNSGQAFIKMIVNRGYWHWLVKFVGTDTEQRFLEMVDRGDKPTVGGYWSIMNLLEELDIPGEWCVEEKTGMLYYYPREGFENAELLFSSNIKPIVKMNRTKNITLEGITIEGGCYIGINIIDGYGNTIKNCTIRNMGNRGVAIDHSGKPGPGNNGVVGCHIYNTALSAVTIIGGDKSGLTHQNDYVVNNHIENFCTYGKHGSAGIYIYNAVGTYIRNNNIHNSTAPAIEMAGNDMYVEYNEMYNVIRDTDDSGVMYDQHQGYVVQGKYVNHNYFHDVWQSLRAFAVGHVMGYYADCTSSSGSRIENNVFVNLGLPIHTSTGKNITIAENVIIDGPNVDSSGISIVDAHWGNRNPGGRYGATNDVILDMIKQANGDFEALRKLGKAHVTDPSGADLYYYKLAYLDTKEFTGENRDNYFLQYPWMERFDDSSLPYSAEDILLRDNGLFDYFDTRGPAIELQGLSHKKYSEDNYVSDKPLMQGETGLDRLAKVDEAMQIMKEKSPDFEVWDVRTTGILDGPKPVGNFDLLSPRNGEKDVATKRTYFFWDFASGADEYRIEVATDADFKNIVHSEIVRNNYVTVTGLKEGVRKYYWRVTAISESDKFYGNPQAGPFSFTTERYMETDKGELSIALSAAYSVLDQIVEGTNPGEYPMGTRATLESVIAEGEAMRSAQRSTKEDVHTITEKINEAWTKARCSIIITEADAGTIFAQPENIVFVGKGDAVDAATNSADVVFGENKISILDKANDRTTVFSKAKTKPYNVMRLKGTISFDQNDGHWVILGLGCYNQLYTPWNMSSYVILIRKDGIELQAFKPHTNSAGSIYTAVPNDYIKMGVPHDLEFAAVPCTEGIRLVFRVDGKIIFDQIDDTYPMFEPGHMMLHSLGPTTTFDIEPAMTEQEYPSLYELLSDPESELNKK